MNTFRQRFFAKIDRSAGPNGCHLWTAATRTGYGAVGMRRSRPAVQPAHRVALELVLGPCPPGLVVLHRCDNRRCVNPLHLRFDTQGENIRDAYRKGRLHELKPRLCAGVMHHGHKLTEADVRTIRSFAGKISQNDLARRYGVNQQQISMIVRRKAWKEVE